MNALTELMKELHAEAQRAYWQDRNDCGGDWSLECQDTCHHNDQCKGQVTINELFVKLTTPLVSR